MIRKTLLVLGTTYGLGMVFLLAATAAEPDRLPDGGVAAATGIGAAKAWYGRPTTRYAHGVLGDAIEGGSLVVIDHTGRRHELVLTANYVFEDIVPRLADLDGDGRNEVVTIRTDVSAGAAVVAYHIHDGRLVERAATAALGRANRWLSIAGIADFRGNGRRQIAIVKTPHIAGVLEVLALQGDALTSLYPPQPGYSTHVIGSRVLTLAGVGDLNGDGAAELALPDQSRQRLLVLQFARGVETLFSVDLPARIHRRIRIEGARRIAAPLDSGETMLVRLP